MEINLEHIKQTEKLLLNGCQFDDERVSFITNLETCDLLAVPGSGKTTALLAKLYCIDKQLPLENNRGVLVLSHTNKAVEEIERVLKPVCPNLFKYPNFVGTIQSFVNHFISNQACFDIYGSYIRKNDNDLVRQEILRRVKNNKCRFYLEKKARPGENLLDVIKSIKYLEDSFLVKGTKLGFASKSGKELKSFYDDLRANGVIFYKDSYSLAYSYLDEYPTIKIILQERFKYIFIDEMQDLNEDQAKLLETIFFDDENSNNIIQRIGDKNQAIYSSSLSMSKEVSWKTRGEVNPKRFTDLSLMKSYRLPPRIAELVDGFVLNRAEDYKVKSGIEEKENELPPYLIIYEDENDGPVLRDKFYELIEKNGLNKSSRNLRNGFHIVSWTTEKENDPDKWHLKKLFPEYSKETNRIREDFDSLAKYIYNFDRDKNTFADIRKSILNGIIRVLRIADVMDPKTQKPYRKSGFIREIKSQGEKSYSSFKNRLYDWCYKIAVEEDYPFVFEDYVTYIDDELSKIIQDFNPQIVGREFLLNKTSPWMESSQTNNDSVQEIQTKIPIKLSSIHSVKGQTHCATMYIDTEYHGYETEKLSHKDVLSNPLYFKEQSRKKNSVRFDETLKMMYVGFSRPTDLLCFAVRKQNVIEDISNFNDSGWSIIDLTE